MLSDLPRDLAEEVLIRLPATSLRAVRCVCKKWNALCKGRSFTKKHLAQAKAAAARESMVIMLITYRVYLMSLNLRIGAEPSIIPRGKLISLDDSDRFVGIREVYHCDGLLLCITEGKTRFVVWNPHSGQTLWFNFRPRKIPRVMMSIRYAIGYENSSKSCRSYKVLRFVEYSDEYVRYEVYYINSRDIATIPITIFPDWHVECDARGVSLKGNTYWFAREKEPPGEEGEYIPRMASFLLCFDFTTERFGPRLTLPFDAYYDEDTVTLSSVRDEQLAVLFQLQYTLRMEIWITTKIEPEAASWSKLFLAVDMEPLVGDYQFTVPGASFFVDEEKKVAVVLDMFDNTDTGDDKVAFIIGEDGYFKIEQLGEEGPLNHYFYPLVCPFVPSLVHIKRGGKRKKKAEFLT